MANYVIPENPQYNEEIRKLENTDPAHAENVFNPIFSRMIENDAATMRSLRSHSHTAAETGARPSTWTPTAAEVGAVPVGRTVNGKALSADISISKADVGLGSADNTADSAKSVKYATSAGSAGSCTGNAATATKLAAARTINGVAFDGTANITVSAAPNAHNQAAGTITAGTLNGAVVAQTNTAYTTRQVRNVIESTAAPSGGATGDIWLQYK